jgi:hypothetical protein
MHGNPPIVHAIEIVTRTAVNCFLKLTFAKTAAKIINFCDNIYCKDGSSIAKLKAQ